MKYYAKSLAASALLIGLTVAARADGDPNIAPAEYVANIRQYVAFLDQSSKRAADRSSSDKVRAFAKAEATEQAAVAKDLQTWEAGQPTGGLTTPMVVSSADEASVATTSDKLLTGRSAAVDRDDTTGVLMASPGVVLMPQLDKLRGEGFDHLYETTQETALKALEGLYEAYSMTGRDPVLRALALRELPLVKQRLGDLDAL